MAAANTGSKGGNKASRKNTLNGGITNAGTKGGVNSPRK